MRPIIIGSGHNGLAAAFYLAAGGMNPLVLERRDAVGGGAITTELHPGFFCPGLTHEVLLHARIVRDMDLPRRGVQFLAPAARVCALAGDGPALVLHEDDAASAASLRAHHPADADAWVAYRSSMRHAVRVLTGVLEQPAPDLDKTSAGEVWRLLKAGRRFRALAPRDRYRLLRWLPMPVADLADEWFTTPLLRAALAGPGVSGTMLGPRSAGTALVMMLREAHRQLAGPGSSVVKGGPGAVTQAMAAAATAAGAEIRTGTPVERILVRNERVVGVVAGGEEIPAGTVVSAIDPRTTFLRLVHPLDLAPDFANKMRNYRARGTVAKVNLALSALPAFRGVATPEALTGRIHIGPDPDYLERAFDHAKYGEFSSAPWLDVTIPSVLDPGLAPAGAHVASIYVHYAPHTLRGASWDAARHDLERAVLRVLEEHAPGIGALIVQGQSISPADLEADYGYAGGHIFHGELAPDQLASMRPLLGYGRYATPIAGLYLCGGGTHPGGFMTATSGRLAAAAVIRSRRS